MDDDGNQVYPRKWNHEFMDVPLVEKSKQNTPSFSSETMSGLAKWKKPKQRMLFILCGSAGFRIARHLALRSTSTFRQISEPSASGSRLVTAKVKGRLKTPSAMREVDIHSDIAALLKASVGDRKSGFLFSSRNGKPLSSSNIIRRHLHLALKELGYVNAYSGTHKAGNHAYQRFRNTYLKNKTGCPEGLWNYSMGHAGKTMDDLYDKSKEDVEFRKEQAEKCGFGFELPSVAPNVSRIV